ncbi:MAG: response regulator [Sediminibacterium sp.]
MLRSLPLKLYGGLAIAVLLVLVVGYVSIDSLEKQQEELDWVKHTNKVVSLVHDIRSNLSHIRNGRKAFWITGDAKFMGSYSTGVARVPNMVQNLKELVVDNPGQSLNVIRFDSLLTEIFRFWGNEGKVDPGLSKEAFRNMVLKEEEILNKVYALIDVIRLEEGRLLVLSEKSVADIGKQTKTILYYGIGILMAVVLLLINSVIQTLKSRYKAGLKLRDSLEKMEALNKFAQEKNWVLEGVSYINNRLQVVESTAMLAERIITSLVQYLELPAGVIYYVDEKQHKLVTAASIAVSGSSRKSFAIGEGIVGNAALSTTPVIIREIPPDYWKVESSLGHVTGNGEIACIPLWMNDELKGLIELGCFVSFSELQISLINSMTDILGATINSYQSRDKINSLLEELQEQKDVLMEQQEELHQTNDELSRQAEELQASEEELKTQEEELKQINVELKQRNEAIDAARHDLSVKAKELEAASRYKSEFLANMSHELRTPLNSVLILAKLLGDNSNHNLTAKQVEYAHIIHKSGKDLLQLINDILDLSKIEAGKVELFVEVVALKDIKADIQQLFTVVAAEKKIDFKIDISGSTSATIQTDKQRLEQVIRNLLSNAFKFTPREGSITLSFSNRDQFNEQILAISVTDTGIGITDEKQQLIFGAFQQADGSTSRKYGGTGLGLSISKELVRLLGGRIDVFSEEGKGSTFTVLLPYEFREAEKFDGSSMEKEINIPSAADIIPQTAVPDDRNNIVPGDKTMLIIEDDVNFARIINDFARGKGYKTIIALQGDEGLFYAKQYNPAGIILDIQLPVIDGWSLLKKLKEDPCLKNIPVHIISAYDDSRLRHAGVFAYLKKPVDAEGLENAFELLGRHIQSEIKKVLIVADEYFNEDGLRHLLHEKQHQVAFDQVYAVESAVEKIHTERYDVVIVNIGKVIQIKAVDQIREQLPDHKIPIIIYLNEDISAEDEMHLKKIADTIIRNSVTASSRLMDELELFLYKMQAAGKKQEIEQTDYLIHDTSLVNKKILVVDDDMRNVFALSAVLESNQLKVVTACDGKEALKQLEVNADTDLVLMDIMMPEMDGYEAMQRIRKDRKFARLPIIALTAKAMAGDRDKCIEAGASDYITKPVDMQKLFSLMRVWLTQ